MQPSVTPGCALQSPPGWRCGTVPPPTSPQPQDTAHLHGLCCSPRHCSPARQHLLKTSTTWLNRRWVWGGGNGQGLGVCGLPAATLQSGDILAVVRQDTRGERFQKTGKKPLGHRGSSWRGRGVRGALGRSEAAEPKTSPAWISQGSQRGC